MGGSWAEQPSREVAGGWGGGGWRRSYNLGLLEGGVAPWPPAIEEGLGGGGGQAVVPVRPAGADSRCAVPEAGVRTKRRHATTS